MLEATKPMPEDTEDGAFITRQEQIAHVRERMVALLVGTMFVIVTNNREAVLRMISGGCPNCDEDGGVP